MAAGRTIADPSIDELVYELLDAHLDTVSLVAEDPLRQGTGAWQAHCAYLWDLQRIGHEMLARPVIGRPSPPAAA